MQYCRKGRVIKTVHTYPRLQTHGSATVMLDSARSLAAGTRWIIGALCILVRCDHVTRPYNRMGAGGSRLEPARIEKKIGVGVFVTIVHVAALVAPQGRQALSQA